MYPTNGSPKGTKGGYVSFHVCLVERRVKASANKNAAAQLHNPTTSGRRYTKLFPGLAGNRKSLKEGRLVAFGLKADELRLARKCCEGYMGLLRLKDLQP